MALELIRESPQASHGKILWPQEKLPVLTGKERKKKKSSAFQKGLPMRASHVWSHYPLCSAPTLSPSFPALLRELPNAAPWHPFLSIFSETLHCYWNKGTNIQNLREFLQFPSFHSQILLAFWFFCFFFFKFYLLLFFKSDIISFVKTGNENIKCLEFSQEGSSWWKKGGKP